MLIIHVHDAFDPNEPRDPSGQWTKGGGGASSPPPPKKFASRKQKSMHEHFTGPSQKMEYVGQKEDSLYYFEPKTALVYKVDPKGKVYSDPKGFGFISGVGDVTNMSSPATSEEQEALKYYGSSGFKEINPALYNNSLDKAKPKVKQAVKHLDSVINKSTLKEDTTLYRTVSDFDSIAKQLEGLDLKKGNHTISFDSYLSTSKSKDWAQEFGEKMYGKVGGTITIEMPKGGKAYNMGEASQYGNQEQELLLGRHETFTVKAYDPENKTITLVPKKKATGDRRFTIHLHDAEFKESDHPRDKGGKFTSGSSGEKAPKKAVHFIGFRGEEYNSAAKVYGKPDFIHVHNDVRAKADIAPGDIVVYGPKADPNVTVPYAHDDSNQRDDPAYWERLYKTDEDHERERAGDKEGYDPNEPRDPSGQWTSGGGGATTKTETKATAASSHLVYAPNRETWPAHIKKLVVPPAWTEVRVSMDPAKPLQVTGRDTKGRLQYLYSSKYKDSQTAAKYKRVMALDKKYDRLNQQVNKDLDSKDDKVREHALATRLILDTGLRPGSEKATGGEVQAYGATTLQASHVVSTTKGVCLEFVGKKGVEQEVPITSKTMQDELKKRAEQGGQIFPHVTDASLRSYVGKLGGGGFKTKDLRTLKATRIANDLVNKETPPKNMKEYKAKVKEVAIAVSKQLGNTPTIALQSYINPAIFAPWQSFSEKQ